MDTLSKKSHKINENFWEELKRQTLIKSTAASMRLSGVNVTEKDVEQIINRGNKAKSKKSTKVNPL